MSEPDVVAELDHWLGGSVQAEPHLILRRARDEIVALRQRDLDQQEALKAAISVYRSTIRSQALEEAAQIADRAWGYDRTSAAIRALKGTASL